MDLQLDFHITWVVHKYEITELLFYVTLEKATKIFIPNNQKTKLKETYIKLLNLMCLSGRIIGNVFSCSFLFTVFFGLKRILKGKIHVSVSNC